MAITFSPTELKKGSNTVNVYLAPECVSSLELAVNKHQAKSSNSDFLCSNVKSGDSFEISESGGKKAQCNKISGP